MVCCNSYIVHCDCQHSSPSVTSKDFGAVPICTIMLAHVEIIEHSKRVTTLGWSYEGGSSSAEAPGFWPF